MSETVKVTEPVKTPPKPTIPSRDMLKQHLDLQATEAAKHVGHPLINPHLWVARNVRPLQDELKVAKEVTPELANRVLNVKFVAPPMPTLKPRS